MLTLLPLLAVPFAVMLFFRVTNKQAFTIKEFLLLEFAMVILMAGAFGFARWSAMADTEKLNGRITEKLNGTQSCCHCRTVCDARDDEGSCTASHEECDHSRDHYWSLATSVGKIGIKSCSGSSSTPSAWANAYVGEPVSVSHTYTNYLKADPDSVLRQAGIEGAKVPGYPGIHSHYKADQALNQGTKMPKAKWDLALRELNADLGKKKQSNIIVIATKNPSPDYADAVEHDWLYGKKNDVIFVLGAPNGTDIEWARVVTISNGEMLNIQARDTLPGASLADTATVTQIGDLVLKHFNRTPMAEFEYLGSAAKPTPLGLFFLYLLAIVGSIGGSMYMVKQDVFGEEGWQSRVSRPGRRW